MTRLRTHWEFFGTTARIGIADFRAVTTWRSWIFGWLARLITQALFFTLIGLQLGSRSTVDYMAVGNTSVLACMEAMALPGLMVRERHAGTLSLHLASPRNYVASYLARYIYSPAFGIFSSIVGFVFVFGVFRIHLSWPGAAFVPLIIVLISISLYAYGFALASVVTGVPSLAMITTNLGYLMVMAFCGVNVPAKFWPTPVHAIFQAFPLTHGLTAIRELLAGAPTAAILENCLLEAAVGLGWLAAGATILTFLANVSRRTGGFDRSA